MTNSVLVVTGYSAVMAMMSKNYIQNVGELRSEVKRLADVGRFYEVVVRKSARSFFGLMSTWG